MYQRSPQPNLRVQSLKQSEKLASADEGLQDYRTTGPQDYRPQAIISVPWLLHAEQLFWLEPKLRCFSGHIYFQQHGVSLGLFLRPFVEFLRQRQAVNTFDHLEQGHGVAAFVGLQVADQMPAQMAGALLDFGFGLLHPALTEDGLSKHGSGANSLRGLPLAHCHYEDGTRVASGAPASSLNPLVNGVEIRGQIH